MIGRWLSRSDTTWSKLYLGKHGLETAFEGGKTTHCVRGGKLFAHVARLVSTLSV